MTPLVVGTVATTNCYKEFLLTKFSLEQYHECQWYVSCDAFTHSQIAHLENVEARPMVASDDCNHNSTDPAQRRTFLEVVLTKFDICKEAIANHGSVLFLDSDMLFVNPLGAQALRVMENEDLDAVLSQHMTNNWQNEAHHGYYNVGMFQLRNTAMIDAWKYLSENHERLGMYYEQKPLEYVQRNFITANFPIYYNIGWWRFNEPQTRSRLDSIALKDNQLFFGDHPAVNFHVHLLKDSQLNYGQFLLDKILPLMRDSDNVKYHALLKKLDELKNE